MGGAPTVDGSRRGDPIEFHIPGSGDDYLDLSSVRRYVRARVVKGTGTDLEDASTAAPVNNWLHSLFCQVDASMNGTLVTPSTSTYPYRAYIETLLSYGAEANVLGKLLFVVRQLCLARYISEMFFFGKEISRSLLGLCSYKRCIDAWFFWSSVTP